MLFVSCRARLFLVTLLLVGLSSAILRADTTFDSGTTTISTGTDFGTNLYVGYSGTATMEIVAGGAATNVYGYLGYNAGSVGVAKITSSTWTSSTDLCIGYEGTGTLNVNGGYVSDTYGWVGLGSGVGVVNITSGTWVNNFLLAVGYGGTGTLNVNGGYVSAEYGWVGDTSTGVGVVNITSGTWANTWELIVGNLGAGTLNVLGDAVVTAGIFLRQGSSGTINMGSGGQVTAGEVTLSNTTCFTGDPSGTGFGTIAAAFGLTYGGVLGLHFGKFYDEGSYSLFSFTSLTPSGGFSSLFSTGTSGGSVYDSISFTSNGSGLWSGMASNGQMLSFNESSGLLSFSAVPEPSAAVMALAGLACGGFSTSRRRRGLPVWGSRGGRRPGVEACPA